MTAYTTKLVDPGFIRSRGSKPDAVLAERGTIKVGEMEHGTTLSRFRQESLMKAYSLDFREKIIDVYFMERMSVRKLAKRFGVATSFVEKLLKGLRETGDILPKPHGGGPQPKLNTEQLQVVRALVEADNDATLTELCDQLAAATSIRISRSTMGRMVQKLGFTRKKNAARHRSGESTGTTMPG